MSHLDLLCATWGHRLFVGIFLLLIATPLKAQPQQLFPNPDFEEKNGCPWGLSNLTVKNWYSPGQGTPDYHHVCRNMIPINIFGYQTPRSGDAYMGQYLLIGSFAGLTQAREYISVKLVEPLMKDSFYEVSIYVSPGDDKINPLRYNNAFVSLYGFYFSTAAVSQSGGDRLPVTPQVKNPETRFLNDTQNWMLVTGIYRASGGEQWVTIGNFDSITPYRLQPGNIPGPNKSIFAYYYIDDASLVLFNRQNTLKDTSICQGDSVMFSASLLWDSSVWNDGIRDTKRNFKQSGTWWLDHYKSGGIIITDTLRLSVSRSDGINKDTAICKDQLVVLAADPAASFLWSTGVQSANITITDTGTYWVQRKVNDCITTDTFIVRQHYFPSLPPLKDTSFCKADSVRAGYPQVNGYRFTWYPSMQTSPGIYIADAGTYILRIDSAACYAFDTIQVDMHEHPVIRLDPDTVVCFADIKQLELDAGAFQSYLWEPTGEITRTVHTTTAMIYRLTVTDRNACKASQKVLVDEECTSELFFPNAFTPNNDGVNDVYEVKGAKLYTRAFSMQIYNRWGVRVFSSNNVYQTWNGTLNNIPQPDDAYLLISSYHLGGEKQEIKMWVTLIR